jgi:lipopolysaccharide/colanic/teichoic acid biosynthesis glycosyltransferase
MYRTGWDDDAAWGAGHVIVHRRRIRRRGRLERAAKRSLDVVAATLLIVTFFWLFIAVWIGVRATTGAPATYSHRRVGRGGRSFGCLKFRSMVVDSDRVLSEFLETSIEARKEWESTYKLRDDPRITPFGRFIRRTSLDELPQLFNVLRGDMSLVGPRPITQRELDQYYGDSVHIYQAVRPGLTGLWQVSGRSTLTYSERVEYDMRYVEECGFWDDIGILLKTVKVVLTGHGSH